MKETNPILGTEETCLLNFNNLNPATSAFPVACCGVSERVGNIISLWIEDSPQVPAESFNKLLKQLC
jgi:hypothetical protein